MIHAQNPASGNGPTNRLVWISRERDLFESLEEALTHEGFEPEHHPLHRPDPRRLGGSHSVLVLEVEEPGSALALASRVRRDGAEGQPTLVVLRGGDAGPLGPALRRGTLDVVTGDSPDRDLILARLSLLRRSRSEVREIATLRRETTRRLRQLRMIYRIGKSLAFSLDPADLLGAAAEALRDVFRGPKTAIFLRDDATEELVLMAQSGHPDKVPVGLRLPDENGLVGAAFRSGEIVHVPDIEHEDRFRPIGNENTRSELVVPIRAGGVVRGVVDLQSDCVGDFDAADREAVATLADEIGAGMANARLYAELRGRSEEIEDAYERLRESDQLKDEFLSSISHELRTPLTSICSFSEILLGSRDEDPGTVNEFMEIIHEESLRLTRLVDNLLDISKMDSGMMTWNITEVVPDVALHRAVQAASSLAQENHVRIEFDDTSDLPRVRMDEDRVIQVLLNLLSNAIKFSGPGSVITVRTRAEASWLEIEVIDRGCGIPAEDLPHIFEKFRQGGEVLRSKPSGSGLGLAICREIAQHHGGQIRVRSEIGRGSTFTFALPLHGSQAPTRRPTLPEEAVAPAAPGEAPLVLVVSSGKATGHALVEALRNEGLRAVGAAGEEDAIRHAQTERPALLVLDLLGAGEGTARPTTLLRRSAETADVPLLLTALCDDPRSPRPAGSGILAQPVDPDALVASLDRLLGRGSPSVLVLEEDRHRRGFICAHLERSGMRPVSAATDAESLQRMRTDPPDVVLIGAGPHDGLLRTLRATSPANSIPILFIAPPSFRKQALLEGTSPGVVARQVAADLVDRRR
jgi:signal transduction histidine kinase/DNA-binding response OmpR family regulator